METDQVQNEEVLMCFCHVLWFGHVCFQWDEEERFTYTFKIDLIFTSRPYGTF